MSLRRIESAFDRLYEERFRALDDESELKFGERYNENHRERIIRDISMIGELEPGARFLEIGPSIVSPIIRDLYDADVFTLCIDELNRNFLDSMAIPLAVCDILRENPPLPTASFDLIMFCQVFEHFDIAPEPALRRVLSLLKPSGEIFFSVPNFASAEKRIKLLFGQNPQDSLADRIPYFAHFREPVRCEAEAIWRSCGGKVVAAGWLDYDSRDGTLPHRIYQSLRYLKHLEIVGLLHIWFPSMRSYFWLRVVSACR